MKKAYNISIALLAVTSVVFVIFDICSIISLTESPYNIIDTSILLIFTVYYAVRFFLAKDRREFFKKNIFDLIAIIPFNSIFAAFRTFRLFRIIKLTKIAKAARLVRAAAFFSVIKKRIGDILRTNGFLYVLYTNIALVTVSSVVIMFAEKMSFGDALWWSIVTCTTVGYGDISPTTTIGRVIAVILMIFGIGLIGMLTGAVTTYFTTRAQDNDPVDDDLEDLVCQMNDDQKAKLTEIAKILLRR